MKPSVLAFILLACFHSLTASAQTYRCKDDTGTTVFQQTPCPQKQGRSDRELEIWSAIDARCRALKASETEFFRCGAEIVCEKNGAVGETRGQCIQQMREVLLIDSQRREREAAEQQNSAAAALAARRAAERAKESVQPPSADVYRPSRSMVPLNCLDVSVLMSDLGMGLYERMAFIDDLARQGACQND